MTVFRCHGLHTSLCLLPLALLVAGCNSGEDFGLAEGYGTITLTRRNHPLVAIAGLHLPPLDAILNLWVSGSGLHRRA